MENKGVSCLGCLAFIFILGLIAAVFKFIAENIWTILWVLGGIVILAALIYVGVKYSKNIKQKLIEKGKVQFDEKYEENERLILQIAAKHKGYVTPADIALRTDLSLEAAKGYLDYLKRKGFARLRIADNGSYVYQFTDLLSEEDKKNAEIL
ncbi:hypothetical protein PAE9249_01859 [Paenibacillus sp. CECT 9249]|nr:hypothetical protein PAE9249_01859 [Paenibacillus sp. CECT 9249]